MKRRRIPGTDLEVSVVGLGCWAIGGKWWGDDVDDARSAGAVAAALDAGINLFDTAPLYGHGHADEVLREALGGRRHEVIVATKVGVRWDTPDGEPVSDLSPDHLRADCEASLRRLGLDVIPLLQIHWPCERGTPLEESLAALEDLRRDGLIRHYGLSNYGAEAIRAARDVARPVTLQTPYSLLRREFEGPLRAACAGEDGDEALGVLAYEPLCRGLLTGKYGAGARFPASDLRARDERFSGVRYMRALGLVHNLGRVARKLRVATSAVALAWVGRQPGVTSALAGAKRAEQVIENAAAGRLVDHAKLGPVLERVAARA